MNWKEKERRDWIRAQHNLPPVPMDWQDKLVIWGSVITGIACVVILLWGDV